MKNTPIQSGDRVRVVDLDQVGQLRETGRFGTVLPGARPGDGFFRVQVDDITRTLVFAAWRLERVAESIDQLVDDVPPLEGWQVEPWNLSSTRQALVRIWSLEFSKSGNNFGVWLEVTDVWSGRGPVRRGPVELRVAFDGFVPLSYPDALEAADALRRAADYQRGIRGAQ
ncbi:hypothetical protein [Nocardia sp. NPDC057227]|uniref:hypothetical protein n=1 Tax=Nocardia sp. NPDC057227 TaxID=3346056 RepID=UPI00363223AD